MKLEISLLSEINQTWEDKYCVFSPLCGSVCVCMCVNTVYFLPCMGVCVYTHVHVHVCACVCACMCDMKVEESLFEKRP